MKKQLLIFALLLLCNLSFAQGPVNNGFENWNNLFIFHEPQGYASTNYASILIGGGSPRPNVFRSADIKHSGNYSAKLESFAQNEGDTTGIPGGMITGAIDIANITIKPGFAYSGRPQELRGYYKYALGNLPDSGLISVVFTKYNTVDSTSLNVIGAGIGFMQPSSDFSEFSIPVFYMSEETPDTAIIMISTTSAFSIDDLENFDLTGAPVGCVMYVDELSFFGDATGIQPIAELLAAKVYPNPANDKFTISYVSSSKEEIKISIYSLDGKLIKSEKQMVTVGSQQINLSVSELNSGMYYCVVETGVGVIREKVNIIR